jgi:ketosteroid isomerase-like protein
MNSTLRDLVTNTFATPEAKDFRKTMSGFADDAVLVDPHFPTPRIEGKAAIAEALSEALESMTSLGYTIVNYFESPDGRNAAVATATDHVHGIRRVFPQVFIVETRDGRITRFQAFEPYGPHGLVGVFLFLARLKRRVLGR